jgi:Bacterial Ig-like domain (group 2)
MNKTWFFPILAPLVLALATGCPQSVGGIVTVSVSPSTATVPVGGTRAFTAVAKDAAGNTVTASFSWTSSKTAVATVDASTGAAKGVTPGSASITATASGVNGSATLNVGGIDGSGVRDASGWDSATGEP